MLTKHEGDFTNVQWANRFGKWVQIRTGQTVRIGTVTGVTVDDIIVDGRYLPRLLIKSVIDLPDKPDTVIDVRENART